MKRTTTLLLIGLALLASYACKKTDTNPISKLGSYTYRGNTYQIISGTKVGNTTNFISDNGSVQIIKYDPTYAPVVYYSVNSFHSVAGVSPDTKL